MISYRLSEHCSPMAAGMLHIKRPAAHFRIQSFILIFRLEFSFRAHHGNEKQWDAEWVQCSPGTGKSIMAAGSLNELQFHLCRILARYQLSIRLHHDVLSRWYFFHYFWKSCQYMWTTLNLLLLVPVLQNVSLTLPFPSTIRDYILQQWKETLWWWS